MHVDESGSSSPYFHRLDDIVDPVVTGKPLSDYEKVEALRTRVVADTRQRIDMFGSDTARTLFLKVSGSHAKYVYERFGHDLKFCHIDESGGDNAVGYACVNVMLSPTFFQVAIRNGRRGEAGEAERKTMGRELPKCRRLRLRILYARLRSGRRGL